MFIDSCDNHRRTLLRFLLLKTAVVRSAVKPGEMLWVQRCRRGRSGQGIPCSLDRFGIMAVMRLDFCELRVERGSSLVLFYHAQAMRRTLERPENRALLRQCGYPDSADPEVLLRCLHKRFQTFHMPHEVGVFLGYPAKDVAGFIAQKPRTPVARGAWAVFGSAEESLRCMARYRQAEAAAGKVLDRCGDPRRFLEYFASGELPAEMCAACV